jgi:Beta-ketoacyl synthase, N-terminal domain
MTDNGRISVLGCGVVTPFGHGPWRAGIGAFVGDGASAIAPFRAVSDDFLNDFERFSTEMKRDRGAWMTGISLVHACSDAKLVLDDLPSERVALVLGNTFAGQQGMIDFAKEVRSQSSRFVSPIHFPQTVGNYVAGAMSRAFGIRGPNITVAGGRSSGLLAVAKGCVLLEKDEADVVLAGGFESLSEELVRGLESGDRDGGARPWAEGACLYVLRRSGDDDAGRLAAISGWRTASAESRVSTGSIDREFTEVGAKVGWSLSAESAMRLAFACDGESTARAVVDEGVVIEICGT